MVLKKKLLDRIHRHSPVISKLWCPLIQLKLSTIWRTGVLRPWGRFVETILGSVIPEVLVMENEFGTATWRPLLPAKLSPIVKVTGARCRPKRAVFALVPPKIECTAQVNTCRFDAWPPPGELGKYCSIPFRKSFLVLKLAWL